MQKEDVIKNTIFLMTAGSRAYGTNTPESDYDYRGVCIPLNRDYYFGFKKFEQYEDKENEIVIYDLRKTLQLISECNPNMVDLLYADRSTVNKITPFWERVQANRELFLSKKARFTYTGYAYAQLKRIKTHRNYLLNPPKKKPERKDYGLPENEKLVPQDQIGAFQNVLAFLMKDSVQFMHLSDEAKKELDAVDFVGLVQAKGQLDDVMAKVQAITGATDSWMSALQQEHSYLAALREFQSYQNWQKQRNAKRAELEAKYGYDTKHAMHLVRLMRMGKEILSEGKVRVMRPDREELLAIRRGAWSYEQIVEYAEKMQTEIAGLYETSTLQREPNRKGIEELCVSLIEEYLKQYDNFM